MTVVFTSVLPQTLISMTVDSAVKREFRVHREYDTGRKAYWFAGVGCVATWGSRDNNHIGRFLEGQNISATSHSIRDLINLVEMYLTQEYRPRELQLDDVGYHVAGFDRSGTAYLHHIFWGFDQPKPPNQTHQDYRNYPHSPPPGRIEFLYNGRNDIADMMVRKLLNEISNGRDTRFSLSTPIDLVSFGDFVARFAAELTPEVGPPFYTYLISPKNEIGILKNKLLCPIDRNSVKQKLLELGYTDLAL